MGAAQGQRFLGVMPWLLLAAAVIASFFASSGPIQWMDNGMYLAAASVGQYFSDSLGAHDHPLYQFLSTAVFDLFGSRALSLLNSILLIPLAFVIYGLAISVGAARNLALLAAAVAELSHALFWVSTKTEVYVFHTLFVLTAYWVFFDHKARFGELGRLFIIGALTGLAASIHQLTFVVLLPLYVQLLLEHRSRMLAVLPGFALGFVAAWPAVLHDLQEGLSLVDILWRYLTGASPAADFLQPQQTLFRFDLMLHEKNAVCLLLLSLIGPQLLGLVFYPKQGPLRLMWWASVLNLVFAASYNVFDRFTFFLPGAALACILGVLQLNARLRAGTLGRSLLYVSALSSPVVLLLVWTIYSNGLVRLPVHSEALPLRDDIHYYLVPYLPDRSAEAFARTYEKLAPSGALIVADWAPLGALRSAQASGVLRGRKLQTCEQVGDIALYVSGPGAFLPRTGFCGNISEAYRLDQDLLGYRLLAK